MKYDIQNHKKFLDDIFAKLKEMKIDVSALQLDHIAYRVETVERYSELKEQFLKKGRLLSENMLKNRPISVFRLNFPIAYKDRKIYCLELPAPSEHKFFSEGYEHVEFVVDSLKKFAEKYSQIEFKISKKEINTEYAIDLGDGLVVKFHEMPLEKVIEIEKSNSLN